MQNDKNKTTSLDEELKSLFLCCPNEEICFYKDIVNKVDIYRAENMVKCNIVTNDKGSGQWGDSFRRERGGNPPKHPTRGVNENQEVKIMTKSYRQRHPFIGALKDFVDTIVKEYPDMSLASFSRLIDGLALMDDVERLEAIEDKQLEELYAKMK